MKLRRFLIEKLAGNRPVALNLKVNGKLEVDKTKDGLFKNIHCI
ncbi:MULTISPECIES: hypothetical protein [Bacillus]|nr:MULTISPECIES: hypothetical protein [Bacillus]MDU0072070.1 hypothetical protein [Bacillus sp. IG6]MED8019671.1 hypothetical protein [Bacillus glycinifermentans]WKB79206.1 hypothetical protein QYM22_10315 [Bacillus glycinifermentans]SCA85779.1 hypothetical protein BGLY_1956 [Bacillus glycinifermentans]